MRSVVRASRGVLGETQARSDVPPRSAEFVRRTRQPPGDVVEVVDRRPNGTEGGPDLRRETRRPTRRPPLYWRGERGGVLTASAFDHVFSWSATQQGEVMAVGPVDVYIIGFPGNKFTGNIAPAILELVENGTIRVLDLLFVMKDADGVVTSLEAADIDEEGAAFVSIDVAQPGALGPEDADEVSDDLPSNSSALLVAFENLWAGRLVDALQAADAVVIDSIRIPVDVVSAALDAS
jgi:hypothetical protein